ncbi:MAG: hypothetical protein ACP6IU_02300 [Candidatus Asgardarchaeia archaeon]
MIYSDVVYVGGVVVRVDVEDFVELLEKARAESPDIMVIHSISGLLSKSHIYLFSYGGITFYFKSNHEIDEIKIDIEASEIKSSYTL